MNIFSSGEIIGGLISMNPALMASGSKSLGKDLGKYQVTEGELRSFGKRFLGRIPTPREFLASPELQEKYMDNKIQFLLEEGVPLYGMYSLHTEGMSGWCDIRVLKD